MVIKGDQMHIQKKDVVWYSVSSPPNHLATSEIATKKRFWLYCFKKSQVYTANEKTITLSYLKKVKLFCHFF